MPKNIALAGKTGSGKTAFYLRLDKNKFNEFHKPTIGLDVFTIKSLDLCIWDLGDPIKYEKMDVYAAKTNAILYFFDGSKCEPNLSAEINHIKKLRSIAGHHNFYFIISKSDVDPKKAEDYENTVKNALAEHAITGEFIVCSAKNDTHVKNILTKLNTPIAEEYKEENLEEILLSARSTKQKASCCSCFPFLGRRQSKQPPKPAEIPLQPMPYAKI